MIKFTSLVTAFIFLLALTAGAQVKEYSDRGPDFLPLKDIRLGASVVDYVGLQQISVEGHILNAAKYKIVTKDSVPFEGGVSPYNNVLKDLDIHYELMVAPDVRSKVHNSLIEVLRQICTLPADERDFSVAGLVGERGQYLLYSGPVSMPNFVWFDGRVVVVRFVRFGERRKDRSANTETFWNEKIRFYPGGRKLVLAKPDKSFAGDFLKRDAAGEFTRSGS